ncbi:MAG: methyltransferase domain-containing protein [Armatimonadota bacterium]
MRYVHGYSEREAQRLHDQAASVRELLHADTHYAPGELVLEAGCGVGAQTVTLASNSPGTQFVCVDIAGASVCQARELIRSRRLGGAQFALADVYALPFGEARFDHLFVCFLLEHLPDPAGALAALRRVLREDGTITVIEGDHGSCYFHPPTPAARAVWQCLIDCQAAIGCDSLIGRRLYPLLATAGYREIAVSPRMVYADPSRPELRHSFVATTITPMVEGVREQALAAGMIDQATWERGIEELYAIPQSPEGTFCYTFFKAVARR